METGIMGILETAAIAISGFLVKKYVFLEPDMEPEKQRVFYGIGSLLIAGVLFALGKDAASMAVLILIGLNICFGRKEHRLRGLFLMIPMMGMINGLFTPVMLVPPYLLSLSAQGTRNYQLTVYGIFCALLLLFFVKGRTWRVWFHENMGHRSLRRSEKCLLWMVGILMMLFSNTGVMRVVGGRAA